MLMRSQLAVLHHNFGQDTRTQAQDSDGNLLYNFPYSRASNSYKAKPKMLSSKHDWRQEIIDRVFRERKRIFEGGAPQPKLIDHIPKTSATIVRPPIAQLTARFARILESESESETESVEY
jgi:hypothetical protein